jgi:hypothetical protein
MLDWITKPLAAAQDILNLSPRIIFLTVTVSTSRSDPPLIKQLKNLYFGMRDSYLRAGLLVQTSQKKYKVIDLNISMSYWLEPGNTKYILGFYEFLSAIREDFFDFRILQIPSFRDTEDLYSGNILPEKVIRKYYKYYGFVHELLDFKRQHHGVRDYEKHYGKWLKDVHCAFQRNLP